MSTRMPLPTARRAVPMAAVVFPLPGPVLISRSPRRDEVMRGNRDQGTGTGDSHGCGALDDGLRQAPKLIRFRFSDPRSLIPVPRLSVAGVVWMSSQNCTCAV